MKNIKDSIKLFRFNMANVVLFELILKAASFAVLIPLYSTFINLAVNLSGISYLTKETVKKFFQAPSTYALIFILFLFTAMCIIVDVSGISYAYHRANYMKKTSPFRMLLVGLRSAIRVLRPRNMPIFIFVLCYMPVIVNIVFDFMLLNIKAPYIVDLVTVNAKVTVTLLALYALLLIYSLRYTFLLHIYNVEKVSFRKSIDKVDELLGKKRFEQVGKVFLWLLAVVGVPVLIYYLYTGPFLGRVLTIDIAVKIVTMIYESVKVVFSFIYVLIGLPIIYAYICNSYYNLVPAEEGAENIDDYEYDAKSISRQERRILAVIIALALILNTGFYTLKRLNIISINAQYLDKVTITAHRGDCSSAPENTLAAFELAIENGADIIELDVRQTKDGEIVVMHDESLKRVCGVNKKVGKLTYEELMKYSPGKKYRGPNEELYREEKIPTLQEVIDLVGDRAKLNIELKPAKTDKNLSQKVAEIIGENNYYDNCFVASLTYGAIRRVKVADPEIKTVYVMAVAMGDFYDLEYADGFSIKYRYINSEIIKQAHKRGKEVYAWTVDDKQILESMMLMNVDSIITNNPAKMRTSMYENYYGDTLIQRINNYFDSQI